MAVVALELVVLRSGLFASAYWVAMAIVCGSWSRWTVGSCRLSAPIVLYREGDTSGLRPVWDILAEEFVYAFALLTLVILVCRTGRLDQEDR